MKSETAGLYPCTIVSDRYSGIYSGAEWTAWPLDAVEVPPEIDSDDLTCDNFWHTFKGVVGKGDTPQAAYDDLVSKEAP